MSSVYFTDVCVSSITTRGDLKRLAMAAQTVLFPRRVCYITVCVTFKFPCECPSLSLRSQKSKSGACEKSDDEAKQEELVYVGALVLTHCEAERSR